MASGVASKTTGSKYAQTFFRGVAQTNSWAFCTEHAPNLARNPWGEGVKFNMAAYE